ncbi:hypothetical protein [Azospirillum brasilense]|uniref:Uncharacterized protein n=1 Tax=Azospirillum brasilense TaxID=192 RepID=A0A6L3B3H5_AZOBR|nr:hypothetical protein [Azospirillum brasilense]KAA0686616.1 hypothetical protein DS837_09150 [Azospirillum brasilense]
MTDDVDFDLSAFDGGERHPAPPLAPLGIEDPEPTVDAELEVVVSITPRGYLECAVGVKVTWERAAMSRREALLAACLVLIEDLKGGARNARTG